MRMDENRNRAWRNARLAVSLMAFVLVSATVVRAQNETNRQKSAVPPSELGRDNLSRVAASAADIKTVLVKDTGLMVELKRWVARDATSQGQIINQKDFIDDAIFDRLQSDVQFRSVATQLVQRYGYLVPQLNPDSAAGKEQELLVKERVKLLAQREEEEEQDKARAKRARSTQNSPNCNVLDARCDVQQGNCDEQTPHRRRDQDFDQGIPPSPTQPGGTNPQAPTGNDQLLRAQYDMSEQGAIPSDTNLPELPLGGSADTALLLGGGNSNLMGGSSRESGDGDSRSGGSLQSISNADNRNAVDALAVYGVGSSRTPANPNAEDLYRSGRRELNQPTSNGTGSTSSSMQPFDRRYQPKPQPPAPELVRARSPYNDIPSLYDMYVQAVPRPAVPKRFGAEVFENGTRDSQLIPMDVPAGPDYIVGPGDGLSIDLWGGVSQRIFRVVDREGRVSLPEVGPVLISGKSLADVQANLQDTLRTQFRQVSTAVSLTRLRTIRVYEVGDIANPGAYDISSLSTPLNAQ